MILRTFGLGVKMDNIFGLLRLIDEILKLDFSVSFDVIKFYQQSITSNDESLSAFATKTRDFVQRVVDNVDHDILTLGGKNTFHCTETIAASIGKLCIFRTRIAIEKWK